MGFKSRKGIERSGMGIEKAESDGRELFIKYGI
jgi:hypothetical protein